MRRATALLLLCLPLQVVAQAWADRFDARDLDEASGLITATAPGILAWAINDSAGGARLFGISASGEIVRTLTLPVANRDWEDLAGFVHEKRRWLLIADVGDNRARRQQVALHWLPEPTRDAADRVRSLRFEYPDGPRDCEAVAVDPISMEVLLLSKRDQPPRLYALQHLAGEKTARFLGTIENLPPPTAEDLSAPYGQYRSQPTALDISSDGRLMLVVTYKDAYLYRREANEAWAAAVQRPPQLVDLPQLAQTEGGAFAADDAAVIVISEGREGQWARVNLPPSQLPGPSSTR